MKSELEFILPEWPAPANIHAYSTTRLNGLSQGAYAGLNLALHVGDNAQTVEQNRALLSAALCLPSQPVWLNQVHQATAINASTQQNSALIKTPVEADASFSFLANQVCVVMTADCLPLLICNRKGDKVAAIHAGWRGLAEGVIESSITELQESAEQLLVWLGPAIGPQAFEVGEEVRAAFIAKFENTVCTKVTPALVKSLFAQNRAGHYLADIYQLARLALNEMGIESVYGGEYCTFNDVDHFYSFRRDGTTGRQASLIWFS